MARSRFLLLVLVAGLVPGCTTERPDAARSPASSRLTSTLTGGLSESSRVPAELRGTTWQLKKVERRSRSTDVTHLQSSLAFADSTVRGRTCNSYSADVDLAGPNRLSTKGFFSTQMRCAGPAGEMDQLVQGLLHGGVTWQRQGDALTLTRGGTTLELAPSAMLSP